MEYPIRLWPCPASYLAVLCKRLQTSAASYKYQCWTLQLPVGLHHSVCQLRVQAVLGLSPVLGRRRHCRSLPAGSGDRLTAACFVLLLLLLPFDFAAQYDEFLQALHNEVPVLACQQADCSAQQVAARAASAAGRVTAETRVGAPAVLSE